MTCGLGKQNTFTYITSCDPFKKIVGELYGLRADGEWSEAHALCCLQFGYGTQ